MPKKNEELEPVQPKPEEPGKSKVEPADKPETSHEKKASEETEKSPIEPVKASAKLDSDGKGEAVKAPAKPRNLKSLAIKLAAVAVTLLALALITFGVLIYVYQSENKVVVAVSQVVPYPVEKVNGSFVPYRDYLFEVDANKRAYQNNAKLNNQPAVDFNSNEGKKLVKEIKQHALDKLERDAVVAQLASEKKISVSSKEVNTLIEELYKRYGGKDTLMKTLDQIYGWNLNDLKGVVRKQLLTQKLQEKITKDPAADAQAKTKAQDVLGKVKAGGDFAELAKQYSQASDASSGGDLGSFTKGQLPDEVQKAADALQPGQVSDLIKTDFGYEILKVTEKTDASTKAMHILIKTVDFDSYFEEEVKKAKTKPYIKV